MNGQLIILQGGEDVRKRTNETLFKNVVNLSVTKKILVIPWTSKTVEKEIEYRTIFNNYFTDSGFQDVLFLETDDNELEITRKITSVDVIYLPGGDPDILYREIEIRSLQNRLRDFQGILIGNSAGAIVLSKGGRGQNEGKLFPGFGFAKFFIIVHFNLFQESATGKLIGPVINIPEDGWVATSGQD
ncbi:MAG: Type 1 glutamine amidotransferase-like domain-containing protein [Thermoplasmataceae archaeon]